MYHTFGIKGIANQLLESCLSDRKQYTKVLNHKSKMARLTHRIPQVHLWARCCSYFKLMIFRWQASLRQVYLLTIHSWQYLIKVEVLIWNAK